MTTAAEKDMQVLNILRDSKVALGPTEIGRRIGHPWCYTGGYGMSAPVTPVLRRIGAVRIKGGKYLKPEIGAQ